MTTANKSPKKQESIDKISCDESLDTDNPVKENAPYLHIKSNKMIQAAVFLCLNKLVLKKIQAILLFMISGIGAWW